MRDSKYLKVEPLAKVLESAEKIRACSPHIPLPEIPLWRRDMRLWLVQDRLGTLDFRYGLEAEGVVSGGMFRDDVLALEFPAALTVEEIKTVMGMLMSHLEEFWLHRTEDGVSVIGQKAVRQMLRILDPKGEELNELVSPKLPRTYDQVFRDSLFWDAGLRFRSTEDDLPGVADRIDDLAGIVPRHQRLSDPDTGELFYDRVGTVRRVLHRWRMDDAGLFSVAGWTSDGVPVLHGKKFPDDHGSGDLAFWVTVDPQGDECESYARLEKLGFRAPEETVLWAEAKKKFIATLTAAEIFDEQLAEHERLMADVKRDGAIAGKKQ